MNLNLAICDDEIKDIELLKKHILQYTIETDNNITVSSYTSAKKLISEYNNHSYNVVLLDIEMPDLSGMELAKQLRDVDDDLLIVFTTFYPEYMQESFNVQPFQFLTKPIDYTSVSRLFSSIFKKFNRRSGNIVVIDSDGEKNFVPINEILFITSMKESKSRIRYQLTSDQLVSRSTLSDVEKQLTPYGFVSPSRGYLVNLRYIRTITSKCVILKNGLEIPISRRRASELQKTYAKYIVQML